jgi:hypothetical protein
MKHVIVYTEPNMKWEYIPMYLPAMWMPTEFRQVNDLIKDTKGIEKIPVQMRKAVLQSFKNFYVLKTGFKDMDSYVLDVAVQLRLKEKDPFVDRLATDTGYGLVVCTPDMIDEDTNEALNPPRPPQQEASFDDIKEYVMSSKLVEFVSSEKMESAMQWLERAALAYVGAIGIAHVLDTYKGLDAKDQKIVRIIFFAVVAGFVICYLTEPGFRFFEEERQKRRTQWKQSVEAQMEAKGKSKKGRGRARVIGASGRAKKYNQFGKLGSADRALVVNSLIDEFGGDKQCWMEFLEDYDYLRDVELGTALDMIADEQGWDLADEMDDRLADDWYDDLSEKAKRKL